MTADELFSEIIKHDAPSAVTFSGGECLLQLDFLVELLKKCKETNIHTAIDTAGYVPFSSFEAVLPYKRFLLYNCLFGKQTKHSHKILGHISQKRYMSFSYLNVKLQTPV